MGTDPFQQFKAAQRESWALFAPLEAVTTMPAALLASFVGVRSGELAVDVACGTGVVAITLARLGARVQGLDLSPVLLEKARLNAELAHVEIPFTEGDVEALPFPDSSFDIVVSQFGHMFAPRPEIAIREMLRVLKPGGRIAFSTWPPEHFTGLMFSLVGKYLPPPAGVAPAPEWGNPKIVRERLANAVRDIAFDRGMMDFPALSPQHYRAGIETTAGPVIKVIEALKNDAKKLAQFRSEFEALISLSFQGNSVKKHFLMTRAIKQ